MSAPDGSPSSESPSQSRTAPSVNPPPPPPPPPPAWSIQGNPVSDTSTATDKLGFAPYVDAVAAFLIHPDTRPPLTLSIEGEWGMGKSSFMRQLQAELDKDPKSNTRFRRFLRKSGLGRAPQRLTFWFNAWRHDTRDAMWATFALSITRNLRKSQSLFGRIRGDFLLTVKRIESLTGWLHFIFAFLAAVAIAVGAAAVAVYPFNLSPARRGELAKTVLNLLSHDTKKDDQKQPTANPAPATAPALAQPNKTPAFSDLVANTSAANPIFAALFFVVAYGYWIRRSAGKSLEFKLQQYLSKPDYQSRVSFVETFHEDFQRVVRSYAVDRKVFIFVDDLDRTDVPKAAELMQAINLMIGDDPHLVFILGIDREKVAAGIALKFKDIQPLLDRSRDGEISARHPAAFGYLYLEKFIQVTFRVPRPSESGIQEFLDSLANRTDQLQSQEARKQVEHEQRKERRRYVDVRSRADSQEVQSLIRMVAPALQWNPRRMKQFINDFRLQAYIASDLGLLDLVSTPDGPERATITLEQLGKFVAITMAWPDLVMDFVDFPELLCAIYGTDTYVLDKFFATNHELPISIGWQRYNIPLNAERKELIKRWSRESTLIALLKEGAGNDDGERFSLAYLDLRVLLNISPKVQRIAAQAQRTTAEAPVAGPGFTVNVEQARSPAPSAPPRPQSPPVASQAFESESAHAAFSSSTPEFETFDDGEHEAPFTKQTARRSTAGGSAPPA